MLRILRRVLRAWRSALHGSPGSARANQRTVARLRARGVRIGEGCVIHTEQFSTEPYLVTLGDRVGISGGVKFLAHDGAAWLLRQRRPSAQAFGAIAVGDDCYIGENALLLAGTRVGRGCIVAAGAVVRGSFPDNSVIAGNPAKVAGRASLLVELLDRSDTTLDTLHLDGEQRRRLVLQRVTAEGSLP